MKKIILISIFTFFFLEGCYVTKFSMGMKEADFVKANRYAELIEASSARDVYRVVITVYGAGQKSKFYYFQNGILTNMDEGVRQPDVVVENH